MPGNGTASQPPIPSLSSRAGFGACQVLVGPKGTGRTLFGYGVHPISSMLEWSTDRTRAVLGQPLSSIGKRSASGTASVALGQHRSRSNASHLSYADPLPRTRLLKSCCLFHIKYQKGNKGKGKKKEKRTPRPLKDLTFSRRSLRQENKQNPIAGPLRGQGRPDPLDCVSVGVPG